MAVDSGRRTGIMLGSRVPTLWLDYTTGMGVTSDGTRVTPKIGRGRKNPNLTDMLDTALNYGAKRIMLSGAVPTLRDGVRAWLLVQTPGWSAVGHRVKEPPVGRFRHGVTGHRVDVRYVSEWFDGSLAPAQAREAWDVTEATIQTINPRQHLLFSPSRTGLSLWWSSMPKRGNELIIPPHVSQDVADDLHRSSGQQHVEHLVAGPNFQAHPDALPLIDPARTPKLPSMSVIDGRFMYAAQGRELGVGPGIRLNREAAHERLLQDPYARAWYEVRFTVPANWNHIGLLGVQHDNPSDGWFYPNRPGARHITWADASEVAIAMSAGWLIEPLQAILFQKARPMDNFMAQINRAREAIERNEDLPRPLRRQVTGALRALLIQTVGALSSRGGTKTVVTESAVDVPAEFQSQLTRHGKVFVYEVPGDKREIANYHPELAIQIWGRARARLLSAPTATGEAGGVLSLPGNSLIAVQGDAIYTTELPLWSVPTLHGGGDDGKTGRLRMKGAIATEVKTPATIAERDRLKARAEKAGPSAAWQISEENQ